MSEESKQLSVAELLARNGREAASGGGRRRRAGRGISVAELTGDLPVIREGGSHSAHSAADDEASAEPAAFDSGGFVPSSFDSPAPERDSFAPPEPATELPTHSPISGPITRYNPLAPPSEPTGSRHGAPAASEPAPEEPARPSRGGRRHKLDPDDNVTMIVGRPTAGFDPASFGASAAPIDPAAPAAPTAPPAPPEPAARPDSGRMSRAARRRAAEAAEETHVEVGQEPGPPTAAWAPPVPDPDPAPRPLSPMPPRPGPAPQPAEPLPPPARDRGALPAWSARRHKPPAPAPAAPPPERAPESGGLPTAAWSLASQDQQLVSGSTVAGDLLRDGVERAEAARRAGRAPARDRDGEFDADLADDFGGAEFADEHLTDVYGPFADEDDDFDDDLADEDFDDDLADDDLADDDLADDDAAPRRKPALSGLAARVKSATPQRFPGLKSRAPAAGAARAGSRGKARDAEHDANRRQWMILGAQSTGAAVAGMLMFKGFERMWEMLPWVALALAMIVILGLVALVRILRRTDDILSTVIAVVVGIFVTLGPLAFLLSTN
nr:hypothetical protein [Nocardia farcinica]